MEVVLPIVFRERYFLHCKRGSNWVAKGVSASQFCIVTKTHDGMCPLAHLGAPRPVPSCPYSNGGKGLPKNYNIVYVQVRAVTSSSGGSLTNSHNDNQPLLVGFLLCSVRWP